MDGEVFYPLYEVLYRYGGKNYKGVVDAANGIVCFSEHPMSLQSRAMVFGSGIIMMVTTFVLCFLFALAAFIDALMILAPVVVFAIGVATSLRIFWTAIRSHSGQEVMPIGNTALDLVDLDRYLPIQSRKDLLTIADRQAAFEKKMQEKVEHFHVFLRDGLLSEEKAALGVSKYKLLSKIHHIILLQREDQLPAVHKGLQEIKEDTQYAKHIKTFWEQRDEPKSSPEENAFSMIEQMVTPENDLQLIRSELVGIASSTV